MSTGKDIARILIDRKMTIAELARLSEIPAQTLYSIINRGSVISSDKLFLIAKALKMDLSELSDFANYKQSVIKDSGLLEMQEQWGDKNRPEHDMLQEFTKNAIIRNLDITEDKQELLYNYNKLNKSGKEEALKRVSELTEIPKYQEEIIKLFAGPNPLKDLPLSSTIELDIDDDKKEED